MSARYAQLSLREDKTGGGTKNAVDDSSDPYWYTGASDCVIFIHGFNVNKKSADKAYNLFISFFDDTFPVAGVYWPGDSKLGWFSFLSYPWEIDTARDCGKKMLDYLLEIQQLDPSRRFHVVCHSLGARLFLETLKDPKAADLNVAALYLMAAAVPVALVTQNGELDVDDGEVALRRVFYSDDDSVLHFAFPAGQTGASVLGIEDKPYIEALGKFGNPPSFPTSRTDRDNNHHSSYWQDIVVTHQIGQDLGLALPTRPAPRGSPYRNPETHQLTEPADPPRRTTPRRRRIRRRGVRG